MDRLVDANRHFLAQAEKMIKGLSDRELSKKGDGFYRSSLGGHFRHCLDHYCSFLNGVAEAKIDYDCRARLSEIETSVKCATGEIQRVREELENLKAGQFPEVLQVKMDCGEEEGGGWQVSGVGRELQFLISHTVHHFAIIGGIAERMGLKLDEDFGKAPSTIRFEKEAELAPAID